MRKYPTICDVESLIESYLGKQCDPLTKPTMEDHSQIRRVPRDPISVDCGAGRPIDEPFSQAIDPAVSFRLQNHGEAITKGCSPVRHHGTIFAASGGKSSQPINAHAAHWTVASLRVRWAYPLPVDLCLSKSSLLERNIKTNISLFFKVPNSHLSLLVSVHPTFI